jgi:hypothetical protein
MFEGNVLEQPEGLYHPYEHARQSFENSNPYT